MICSLPWIHLSINNDGNMRVCCHSVGGPGKGILKKDNDDNYNALNDNIEEARNSQKLKDIRKSFLNNKWHPECIRCQKREKIGMNFMYNPDNNPWKYYVNKENILKYTEPDGTIDPKIFPLVYLELRLGNKCNLACRICFPTESSSWYKDWYNIYGSTFYNVNSVNNAGINKITISENNGKYTIDNDIYNTWYKLDNFWKQMEYHIPNFKHVYMIGGEPLIINEHYTFLKKCIDSGYAKNITIEYNTNLSIVPNKAWDLWKHFKLIDFGVSIDGVGKHNDYMRYHSKWENIVSNIDKIINNMDNYKIRIATTVSILNILYLPELFNWIIEQNFPEYVNSKNKPFGSIHPLHSAPFNNIKCLPLNVKHKIKKHLEEFTFNKYNEIAKETLKNYIDFMFEEDKSENFPKFLEMTDKLDKLRNQSFENTFPELNKILKGL